MVVPGEKVLSTAQAACAPLIGTPKANTKAADANIFFNMVSPSLPLEIDHSAVTSSTTRHPGVQSLYAAQRWRVRRIESTIAFGKNFATSATIQTTSIKVFLVLLTA